MCPFLLCSYVDPIMFAKEIAPLLHPAALLHHYNEAWLRDGECELGSANNERRAEIDGRQ